MSSVLESIANFHVRGSGVDRDSGAGLRADQSDPALGRIREHELRFRAPADPLDLGPPQLGLGAHQIGPSVNLIPKKFSVRLCLIAQHVCLRQFLIPDRRK